MGNPNIEDPFASAGIINPLAPKEGAGRITRGEFIAKGLTFLVALKSTNILAQGADLPKTYDAIMDALSKGQLTYEQLLEIGKTNLTNFTDEQRKVLSGELAKLKMAKDKTVVKVGPRKELSPGEKKAEKQKDTLVGSFNASVKKKDTWKRSPNGNQDVNSKEKGGHVSLELKMTDKNAANPNAVAVTRTQIAPGEYELKIDATSGAILWLTDGGGKCIDMEGVPLAPGKERILFQPGTTDIKVPANCTAFTLGFQLTPLNPEITITKIELSKKIAGGVLAGK